MTERMDISEADRVMLKDAGSGNVRERGIYDTRPLTDEELKALADSPKVRCRDRIMSSMPKIVPYFTLKEMRYKGERKMVPFIGIRGEF